MIAFVCGMTSPSSLSFAQRKMLETYKKYTNKIQIREGIIK